MNREWMDDAFCRQFPSEFFHPEEKGASVTAALKVCGGCPVRVECLTANLHEREGIWGGTTPNDRRRLRRLRKAGESLAA